MSDYIVITHDNDSYLVYRPRSLENVEGTARSLFPLIRAYDKVHVSVKWRGCVAKLTRDINFYHILEEVDELVITTTYVLFMVCCGLSALIGDVEKYSRYHGFRSRLQA
jgi:hypothetical protein